MESLRQEGLALTHSGRPAEAMDLLRRALAVLDEHADALGGAGLVARCNTLITLGLTQFLQAGLPAADAVLAEADTIADRLDDADLRARVAYQRAMVHGRAGDLRAARESLDVAARRLDAFTPREQCSVLLSQGMLALEQTRAGDAERAFVSAADLARDGGFRREEFMARHNAGYAAYLQGDLPRALAEMDRAERIDADVSRATARLDHGKVLLEAGLVSEAVEVFEAGVRDCSDADDGLVCAEFRLELAHALRMVGRLDAAERSAASAAEAYAGLGARAWEVRARLVVLRVRLERVPDPSVAPVAPGDAADPARSVVAEAERLARTADEVGDHELVRRCRTVAAAATLAAEGPEAALSVLDDLGELGRVSLAEDLDRATVAVGAYAASGQVRRARRLLGEAARALAEGQQGSASLDLRTARAVHGVRLAELDLRLARSRGASEVLETLERWYSATDRLPRLGRPDDAELAALTERLRGVHFRLRDEDGAEREALLGEARDLERRIRDRDRTLSAPDRSAGIDLRVRQAREVLDGLDRDLVWFFTHGDRVHALAIVRGRARRLDLADRADVAETARRVRADLRVAATRNLGPMADAVWGSLRAGARRLDDALVRPWRRHARPLVVVPCPELAAIPWSLLPGLAGQPVAVARSLTAFARRSGTAREPGPSVHVSVGPDIDRGREEAERVGRVWGPAAATELRSSAATLVRALGEPGLVHVAAHGRHEVESPLFSSLALHDGPVFAHELQRAGVAASHVVLSACEAGTATFRPGDEVLGMAASMLSLGARSVVAAVAPVPDDVAAEVMVSHHRGLRRGLGSDEALAEAIAASDPLSSAFLNLGGRW